MAIPTDDKTKKNLTTEKLRDLAVGVSDRGLMRVGPKPRSRSKWMRNPRPRVKVEIGVVRCAASGKRCYRKQEAQYAKNTRERHGSERMRIYACPECNWWHLTSQVRR